MSIEPLSAVQISEAAKKLLLDADYHVVLEQALMGESSPAPQTVYEDKYGIVAVAVFDSWRSLRMRWPESQSLAVELISQSFSRRDPKAWDGYLLLFTPDVVPDEQLPMLTEIRRDMTRLRKLIASGNELEDIASVERAMLPVLPLKSGMGFGSTTTILSRLPELMEAYGVDPSEIVTMRDAFLDGRSPIEALYDGIQSHEA